MEAYDADELTSYRSVSSLAILAFVLGMLSPLALVSPLLFVIPLAGLGVALMAIKRISVQPEVLTGLLLAKVALFVCVFCLAVVPAKTYVSSHLYKRQADQTARLWLKTIVDGDLENSIEKLTPNAIKGLMRSEVASTPPEPGQTAQPDTPSVAKVLAKNAFVKNLTVQALGGPLEYQTLSMDVDTSQSNPMVGLEYQANSKEESAIFYVYCVRSNRPGFGEIWQIEAWKLKDDHGHLH